MQSLLKMSEKYNIAVIASIHQPNQEIFMMFNKVYVLAKGGNCVYSGKPENIQIYLQECDILCESKDVPIEILLGIASEEIADHKNINLKNLIPKTKQNLEDENYRKIRYMKIINELQRNKKSFKLKDTFYLLSREIAKLKSQLWKIYLIQLIFYISFPVIVAFLFKEDMAQTSGCFQFNQTKNCAKYIEDDDKLLQNQTFLLYIMVIVQFTHICNITFNTINDTRIFINEFNNGMFITRGR